MKTLQQNDAMGAETETHLWLGKTAREVLREAYHDNCIIKPIEQPKSTRTDIVRPVTYTVYDRTTADAEIGHPGEEIGTLVELP